MKIPTHPNPDTAHAVEIAPKIWWVGHVLENDPFQCHVYLIENGDDSILLDPGSRLTWPHTRRKILEVLPLEKIRYIVCHHQDPDITLAVTDLLEEIGTEGRCLVTHWRAAELLDHYDWGVEYYEVQANGWRLEAGDRRLRFVFTPYMHFPGAFCTYDEATGILFSSDIFGAITETFSLYAKDAESYFKQMEPFHTHYMPATEIVNHGLDNIEKCRPISMIAPQHGSIVPGEMVETLIRRLRKLKCGLYIEFGGTRKIELMSRVNTVLPEVFEAAAYFDSFHSDSRRILESMGKVFPILRIVALGITEEERFIRLDSDAASVVPCKRDKEEIYQRFRDLFVRRVRRFTTARKLKCLEDESDRVVYLFPLLDYDKNVMGVGMFVFDETMETDPETLEMLRKFEIAIDVIAKREVEVYRIESERKRVYTMAITDSLTGLYNRYYLDEVAGQELAKSKRYDYPVSVLYLDLDHFKKVNDTYGHDIGDIVLKRFAHLLRENIRESDMAFRLGGEEFLVMMPYTDTARALEIGKRLRDIVKQEGCVTVGRERICYTFSGGVTDTGEAGYDLETLLKRADEKLYEAKRSGRDRIVA
ncbi:oxygen-binding di-iron domain-containing protein [Hydrogenimonas sp.]